MKNLAIIAFSLFATTTYAQQTQKEKDWYNCSFEKEGVYGAEVNKAYEFLGGSKTKHTPVIAIIGSGVDIEHEALVKNLWVNKKEKADGIDNDKNGWVDDINGWSFIGTKDGSTMSSIGKVADREFLRLKDQYGDILTENGKYFIYKNGQREYVPAPENMEEYNFFKDLGYESQLASTYFGWVTGQYAKELVGQIFAEIRAKNPGKTKLDYEDFKTIYPDLQERGAKNKLFGIGYTILSMHIQMTKNYGEQKDPNYDYMAYVEESHKSGGHLKKAWDNYTKLVEKYPLNVREEKVGDNCYDFNSKNYGNNVLLVANSGGCTLGATIMAGKRGVEGRNNPICENAKIMPLVVVNQQGEPYAKDICMAIRYAVDNGADVICFSAANSFSPVRERQWLADALAYAESKGVLMVVSGYDESVDLDKIPYYPNRFMTKGKELSNILVVASSNAKGEPELKSNFGAKSVDVFAPGINILSGYISDTYKVGSGQVLAMSVTAGIAALIKSYYPNLNGSEIRTIINENVTSREGVEVEKMVLRDRNIVQDAYLFDELCLSKGIVNCYKAVVAADKLSKNKK